MRLSLIGLLIVGCGARTGFGDRDLDSVGGAAPGGGGTSSAALRPHELALGFQHACAVDAGRVRCWGFNEFGQLGDGTKIDRHTPVFVSGVENVVEVAAGGTSSCARTAADDVWCWGDARYGQLGDAVATLDVTKPQRMPFKGRSIVLGPSMACAVGMDDALSCWGTFTTLSLGLLRGDPCGGRCSGAPKRMLASATAVAIGPSSVCAVDRDQRVWCWGKNSAGQLGDGTTIDRTEPVMIPDLRARSIGVGNRHACAVRTDGAVVCWGDASSARLGALADGPETCARPAPLMPSPREVPGIAAALDVTVGNNHSCARTASSVRCWGANNVGELGVPPAAWAGCSSLPVELPLASKEIAAGAAFVCAMAGDRYCWGMNHFGEIGDGTTLDRHSPTQVIW